MAYDIGFGKRASCESEWEFGLFRLVDSLAERGRGVGEYASGGRTLRE